MIYTKILATHLFYHQKQVAEYLRRRTIQAVLRGRYLTGCVGLTHSPANGLDCPNYVVTVSSNVLLWFIKYVFCVGFFVIKVQSVIC